MARNTERFTEYDRKRNASASCREWEWRRQGIVITYQEYLERYDKCGGRCEICSVAKQRLHVDHDHKTNRIRGLLCTACNLALEQIEIYPLFAKRLQYLLEHEA